MEQPTRDKKCPKCKAWRFKTQFIAKDREMKTCEICRARGKKYIDKNRNKINEKNKIYKDEQKQTEPLQYKFKEMVQHSKSKDKKYNLTITEDYITLDYLNELWRLQDGKCFYQDCECVLDYESFDKNKRNPKLITIQRHNNDICHSQNNTCLSCWNCNVNKHKEREHFTEILIATNKLAV